MDPKDHIELLKQCVIQIATPYSTGTGFYLKSHDAVITSEHVVRGNKQVVVEGHLIERQLAEVFFVDDKYDIAFLRISDGQALPEVKLQSKLELTIGDQVYALGHPFGSGFTATLGILSNVRAIVKNIPFIQHDATLSPGNSGGPLMNEDGQVIGVNCFVKRGEQILGYALPSDVVMESLDQFEARTKGSRAVRCKSCAHIIHEVPEGKEYCSVCGSKISFISNLTDFQATGIPRTIEAVLQDLEYDVALTRRGLNQWEVQRGSALITLSYHEKSGIIVGESILCNLPKEGISEIYRYLLQQNEHLRGLSFSVKGMKVVLSIIIHDQYLIESSAKELLRGLFEKSDNYDDILIEQFGAQQV